MYFFVNVIGALLILLALRRLSKAYNNDAIWRNALYAIVTNIIGLILILTIAISLASSFTIPSSASKVGVFLISYVFILVSGWFMKNAYSELSKSSGVEYFSKVAKWYWISAILTIIAVGLILLIIAQIYMILGFRRLKNLQ